MKKIVTGAEIPPTNCSIFSDVCTLIVLNFFGSPRTQINSFKVLTVNCLAYAALDLGRSRATNANQTMEATIIKANGQALVNPCLRNMDAQTR